MKPSDTIDVLICVHSQDTEHDILLQRALESLVRQTYDEFAVVVVLDECHEYTRGIVECYKDVLDIRLLERPRKQGLAAAKNYGLGQCTADWVTYLDADDQWMDCKLEVQRKWMMKESHIDFCGTEAWDLQDGVMTPNCFNIGDYNSHADIISRLPHENILCHGSMMIRKIAIDSLGGYSTNKSLLGREDWDLWVRAARGGFKFMKVPERLYIYSLGTGVPR
jgi:glycosyltransferase involved in cell wall biosynthesis